MLARDHIKAARGTQLALKHHVSVRLLLANLMRIIRVIITYMIREFSYY